MNAVEKPTFHMKKKISMGNKPGVNDYNKSYLDLRIERQFQKLEVKIVDCKNEMLSWFIKMFISQLAGLVSIFIALMDVIKNG